MNEYTAIIDNKEYVIKINKRNSDTSPENLNTITVEDDSSEICLNAVLEEYQHSVRRSEKLDNKVYILSTICGFIFVFITDIISNLGTFQVPTDIAQTWLVRSYIALTILMSLIYLYTILKLGILLTAKQTLRLTPDYLILEKVYDKKEKHARIFVASLYIQAINDANESLKKRFKSFNWCAYRTAMVLFLAFALHFLNLFITKAAS